MLPNTGILQTAAPRDGTFPRRVRPLTDEASTPLEGEHIETNNWEDARHWMSIYGDLLEFKRGILDRIRLDLAKLSPVARSAAEQDYTLIAAQMDGYQKRLDLWHQRLLELGGLWLEPEGRVIRYQGKGATLTVREFQLLQFLLNHPYRFFTVPEILGQAWAEPTLSPEEVRNYVRRVRKVIAALKIPCDVVNRPGRGYSLEFHGDK
jgi:Transcriptional regulatory protein, C terminal